VVNIFILQHRDKDLWIRKGEALNRTGTMKSSHYNLFIPQADGGVLAYNCLRGGFGKISREEYETYQAIENNRGSVESGGNPVQLKRIEELKKGGFIVEDNFDEFGFITATYYLSKFNSRDLSLVIAPTLDCNFQCSYCFEVGTHEYMSKETQEAIVHYVETQIVHLDSLRVTWFGGEPTLALDTVFRLSKKLMEIASREQVVFAFSMISNGYLLDKKVAVELKGCGISNVQITIDGPPEVHNKRRPLKGGGGTFDTILHHLLDISDIFGEGIFIRVNIDSNNLKTFSALLDVFEDKKVPKSIGIDVAQVHPWTPACQSVADCSLSTPEYARLLVDTQYLLFNRGFRAYRFPAPILANCHAVTSKSLTIAPNGDLFKCGNTIGVSKECFGNILRPTKLSHNEIKWLAWNPLSKGCCRRCKILPICMGGCAYIDVVAEHYVHPSNRCSPWKYNLKDILSLTYEQRKLGGKRCTEHP